MHVTTVGQQKVAALGSIEGTAAADADKQIDIRRPRHSQAGYNVIGRRVLVHVNKRGDRQPGRLEAVDRMLRMPRLGHAVIADNQHPAAVFACQLTEPLHGSAPINQAVARR